MKIDLEMDLSELAERMGSTVPEREALIMRALLVDSGYNYTETVPDSDWLKMIDLADTRDLTWGQGTQGEVECNGE